MTTMTSLPRPIAEYLSVLAEKIDAFRTADPEEIDPETAHMMHVDGEILAGLYDWLGAPDGDVSRLREHLEILRDCIEDARALAIDPREREFRAEWRHDADVLSELVEWLTASYGNPSDN